MSVKLHLILQELVIGSSREWVPGCQGWIVLRVADGAGYWLKPGTAGELNIGDGLVLGFDDKTQLRASVLCPLKLQFFIVYPQYLGLLTVEEWHEFNTKNPSPYFLFFRSNESTGQEFTRLVEQSPDNGFPARCARLQFWANIAAEIPISPNHASAGGSRLRDRFRQMFRQMSENELSVCSPPELAQQLNCSLRHFCRLFREEFGVPFREHQTEQRLLRTRQLLVESDATAISIASQQGFPHMSFFNSMFKKRFGMTPGEWRQQTRKNLCSPGHPPKQVIAEKPPSRHGEVPTIRATGPGRANRIRKSPTA